MTVLAIVPLLTVLLSVVHGIERPRVLGIVGALIAAAGIVIVAADQLSLNVPMVAIALLLVAAVCQAESVVIVKRAAARQPGGGKRAGHAPWRVAADRGQPWSPGSHSCCPPSPTPCSGWPT